MIRQTKVELLRQGPRHNQLLSPLTPYLALCGPYEPQTVYLPFEHQQLLLKLARLHYNGAPNAAHAQIQRQGELEELGKALGEVVASIAGLRTAIDIAKSEKVKLLHIRLSISALELSMVPFEVSISPTNFTGAGTPLLLHSAIPVVLTRETRRIDPLTVTWSRPPKILFVFAAPGGLKAVPAQAHLNALRRAIEPYVKIADSAQERLDSVKDILTVIPNATLQAITEACNATDFTYIHILAHGVPTQDAGQSTYGLALHTENSDKIDIVTGQRLSTALQGVSGKPVRLGTKPLPTLISLATCDSGHVDSVLTPGGSIAHSLHESGVPWVIASQFPLWMRASTIVVESLYGGILSGFDPRWVLWQTRQRLHTEVLDTHDWASIVAYAVTPWNFEVEVRSFYEKQRRKRLEIRFDRLDQLDQLVEKKYETQDEIEQLRTEVDQHIRAIYQEHEGWLKEIAQITDKKQSVEAEALGMAGASQKRIGLIYTKIAAKLAKKEIEEKALNTYLQARDYYQQALFKESTNHWVLTQFLAISAIIEKDVSVINKYANWWQVAYQLAEWAVQTERGEKYLWACGSLAELILLSRIYQPEYFSPQKAITEINRVCLALVQEIDKNNTFPLKSTKRQFERYITYWHNSEWDVLAREAMKVLGTVDTNSG